MIEKVNHPAHYGGGENPYEAIKVIEAWGLGFCLGNAVKYIARAGRKGDALTDLRKAAWYLQREIERINTAVAKGAPEGPAAAGDRGFKTTFEEIGPMYLELQARNDRLREAVKSVLSQRVEETQAWREFGEYAKAILAEASR